MEKVKLIGGHRDGEIETVEGDSNEIIYVDILPAPLVTTETKAPKRLKESPHHIYIRQSDDSFVFSFTANVDILP